MIVIERLNVSAKSFFDRIIASIAYEASQAKGKTVEPSKICKGYSYNKVISRGKNKSFDTKVKLTDITPPTSYAAKLTSTQGVNTLSYKIDEIEPGKIEITYEESFEPAEPNQGFGAKLARRLSEKRGEKRVRDMLHQIEKCALEADRIDAINAEYDDGDEDAPEVELGCESKPIAEPSAPASGDED